MDFNYLDFIGFGEESFLAPLAGVIFFPVLFPLYLVLKILIILIEFFTDVISSLFKRENIDRNNNDSDINVDQNKIEQIKEKIEELKEQKKIIEDKIKEQEKEISVNNRDYSLNLEQEIEKEKILSLKIK